MGLPLGRGEFGHLCSFLVERVVAAVEERGGCMLTERVSSAGNKTAGTGSNDSTMGKLMEKAGEVLKKDSLVEKGHEKREAAGYGKE